MVAFCIAFYDIGCYPLSAPIAKWAHKEGMLADCFCMPFIFLAPISVPVIMVCIALQLLVVGLEKLEDYVTNR